MKILDRITERGLAKIRKRIWFSLSIVTIFFVFCSIMTAFNYFEIVYAKTFTTVDVEVDMTIEDHLYPEELSEDATFSFWVNFTVYNPSNKDLRMWLIGIELWVRDHAREDRTDLSRSTVDIWVEGKSFYPIVVDSKTYQEDAGIVNSHSSEKIDFQFELARDENEIKTVNLIQIYNYAVKEKNISIEKIEWLHSFRSMLFIKGVCKDYSGFNTSYLIGIPTIDIKQQVIYTQEGE